MPIGLVLPCQWSWRLRLNLGSAVQDVYPAAISGVEFWLSKNATTFIMSDPLSIASSVVALVTFALQSSVVLYGTVRSFQSQDRDVRALKDELNNLNAVLECLLATVTNHPELEFEALKVPLHRCGKVCEEYGDIIARCTKHSTGSRPSIRDWITQKYLQGDIDDFRAMLAGYKSTINIALANTNM